MSGRGRRRATIALSVVVIAAATGAAGSSVAAPLTVDPRPVAGTDAPDSATIEIDRDAAFHGYTTTDVTMAGGGSLTVVNRDRVAHTVTSDARDKNDNRLFDVRIEAGQTASIPAASQLAAGNYGFHCQIHPGMTGKLHIVGDGGGGITPARPKFEQPLVVPKVLTDHHIRIPIERSRVRVLPDGNRTPMWTYGGSYPGPTIMRPAGHDTKVTFVDKLPSSDGAFTVHFHGDHHRSADDGRPTTQLIRHGESRTYDYPLTDGGKPERAAFDFYHDHRMGLTARNNWMGLQGMFLVTDGRSKKLGLPSGKYDVPLMVSERSFNDDNTLTHPFPSHPMEVLTGPDAPPGDATVGDRILANGRFAPYLNVSTHRYRLRLLNASPFTSYNFRLSDGQSFLQVGTGNGLLPHSVFRRDILLGPAQRADVIVDFHGELNKKVVLETVPRTDGTTNGVESATASIMQFRVTKKASDHTKAPATLQPAPKIDPPKQVSTTWTFDIGGDQSTGSYWTVNGEPFDPKRVTVKVPLGATRTWKLHNASNITHYIHLHEEQWHTLARDGHQPPPWERGLEDTWRLDPGETVKVAGHFTDYTGKFMIHCHMLDHEDHGLMAQFEVVRPKQRRVAVTDPVSALLATAPRSAPTDSNALLASLAAAPDPARPSAFAGLSDAALSRLMCGLDGKRTSAAAT